MNKFDINMNMQDQHNNAQGITEVPDQVNSAETSLLQKIFRSGLVETDNEVEIQRQDPKSPLYSGTTFEDLHLPYNLLKAIYEMGYNKPSKIQEAALPCLLAHPPLSLVAQSQSGTGKTAAFVLAMLSKVDPTKHYPQVLCISPTYELAIQTGEVATDMAKYMPEITMKYAVRGEFVPGNELLKEHIIFGTPGKVVDWALKYKVIDLKKISVFVLDEADVILSGQGHRYQCIRIHRQIGPQCQMMFFSATFNDDVVLFAEIIAPRAIFIRLRLSEACLDNIRQYYLVCVNAEQKYQTLSNIYSVIGVGQCIIFCNTRERAVWLASKMIVDGHVVGVLTGSLAVNERIEILDHFRASRYKVLVTTNVLSRGIDIEKVTIVVNFDMPMDVSGMVDCETYLHRIGRTGRFGKYGIAINLIDSQRSMEMCRYIETHYNIRIKQLSLEEIESIQD